MPEQPVRRPVGRALPGCGHHPRCQQDLDHHRIGRWQAHPVPHPEPTGLGPRHRPPGSACHRRRLPALRRAPQPMAAFPPDVRGPRPPGRLWLWRRTRHAQAGATARQAPLIRAHLGCADTPLPAAGLASAPAAPCSLGAAPSSWSSAGSRRSPGAIFPRRACCLPTITSCSGRSSCSGPCLPSSTSLTTRPCPGKRRQAPHSLLLVRLRNPAASSLGTVGSIDTAFFFHLCSGSSTAKIVKIMTNALQLVGIGLIYLAVPDPQVALVLILAAALFKHGAIQRGSAMLRSLLAGLTLLWPAVKAAARAVWAAAVFAIVRVLLPLLSILQRFGGAVREAFAAGVAGMLAVLWSAGAAVAAAPGLAARQLRRGKPAPEPAVAPAAEAHREPRAPGSSARTPASVARSPAGQAPSATPGPRSGSRGAILLALPREEEDDEGPILLPQQPGAREDDAPTPATRRLVDSPADRAKATQVQLLTSPLVCPAGRIVAPGTRQRHRACPFARAAPPARRSPRRTCGAARSPRPRPRRWGTLWRTRRPAA